MRRRYLNYENKDEKTSHHGKINWLNIRWFIHIKMTDCLILTWLHDWKSLDEKWGSKRSERDMVDLQVHKVGEADQFLQSSCSPAQILGGYSKVCTRSSG